MFRHCCFEIFDEFMQVFCFCEVVRSFEHSFRAVLEPVLLVSELEHFGLTGLDSFISLNVLFKGDSVLLTRFTVLSVFLGLIHE